MPTKIEWVRNIDGTPGETWNVIDGCSKISSGCDQCYAESIARRFAGTKAYPNGFNVTVHPERLTAPLKRRKPTTYFVNSMGDVFHDDVPDEAIVRMWAVMAATPQHTYIVLTKRHGRMRSFLRDECRCGAGHQPGVHLRSAMAWHVGQMHPDPIGIGEDAASRVYESGWPLPNVWVGVSVENQQWADIRIPALLDTPAAVRLISAEPLLGPIDLYGPVDQHGGRSKLNYWLPPGRPYLGEPRPEPTSPAGILVHDLKTAPALDWVIAGAESGPKARPAHPDWFRSLRDQCAASGVPYLFKQWGHHVPEAQNPQALTRATAGRALYIELDGSTRPAAFGARGKAVTVQPVGKARSGRRLDGRVHDDMPARHIPAQATP